MSFIDGLIRGMKINSDPDDDDMDDEDVYEDEDDYEPAPSRHRTLPFSSRRQRDDEEDDYEEQQPRTQSRPAGSYNNPQRQTSAPAAVAPSRRKQAPAAQSNMQVRVIKPSSFDQARQITDTLLSHRTVLLNLEGLDVNTAQRIVDFASGSCYALRGNFMKISHFIIVITPEDVDIAGDITPEAAQTGDAASAMAMGAIAGAAGSMANQNTQSFGTAGFTGTPRFSQG